MGMRGFGPFVHAGFLSLVLASAGACGGEEEAESRSVAAPTPVAVAPTSAPVAPTPAAPAASALGAEPLAETSLGRDLEASPSWSYSQEATRNLTGPRHRTNVPQVESPGALFDSLGADAATEGDGMLLCRVSISRDRNWDAAGIFGANVAPDPTLRMAIGGSPTLIVRIAEDTYESTLSIPHVALEGTTPFSISLVDRDLARDDTIGSATVDWSAFLAGSVEVGGAELRCSLAPEVWLARRVDSAIADADRALRLLPTGRQRVEAGVTHVEARGYEASRRAIHALATLVGWSDPRALSLLERLGVWEARYWATQAEAFRAMEADAHPAGTTADLGRLLKVRLDGFSCDPARAAQPCEVRLTVTRTRAPGRVDPPRVSIIAAGVPAATCIPLSSTSGASGSFALPQPGGEPIAMHTNCRQPAADGSAGGWLVLVRSGARAEVALALPAP